MTPVLNESTRVIASVGGASERVGVAAVVVLAAFCVLAAGRAELARWRALAMLAALILTPVLLIASIWHSPQLHTFRHHPPLAAAAIVGGLGVVAALALLFYRRRELFAVLAIAAVPFRLPISSGGTTSNLLIPLYLVVAAGALAYVVPVLRAAGASARAPADERAAAPAVAGAADDGDPPAAEPAIGAMEWLLMGLVVVYGLQAAYSSDFTKALENVVFFYVPFALLFALLRGMRWTPRLILMCFGVAVVLAVVFVGIGFVEYSRRALLLNPKVIGSNEFAAYFRVNSLFFDPNIYGRFLAIVMVAIAAMVIWTTRRRVVVAGAALLALLWGGLVLSFSQSSIAALLLGLAVLAALRWDWRRTLAVCAVALAAGAGFVALAPGSVHLNLGNSQSANNATSGRYQLVKGGVNLFADRPLQGYGPGSFPKEFRIHDNSSIDRAVSASHTTPITIAAEQGVLGLLLYVALLVAALRRLFPGASQSVARAAIAAAFAALLLHTFAYADFLEDPTTWTLLGIGVALAAVRRAEPGIAAARATTSPPAVATGAG